MRNNRKHWLAVLSCLAALSCSSKNNKQPGSGTAGSNVSATSGSGALGASGISSTTGTGAQPASTGASGSKSGTSGQASGATGGTHAAGGAAAGTTAASGGAPMTGASGTGSSGTRTTSVLQFHNNATRDGVYIEPSFTRMAAANIHLDSSFTAMMSGPTYAQPLYFEGGPGGKDLLIVATETNEVTAFSATDGSVVWRKSIAPAGPAGGGPSGCALGDINPLGITGTPVIDAASRTVFFDAMSTGGTHQIYALSLDDGSTVSGWPVDVSTVKAGSQSFNPPAQNQRGALLILNGNLYVPYGGHYGDCGDYHGWVVGVPLANPKGAFGWATRASAGGIWAPSGLASDGTSVFAATGNTMAAAPSNSFPAFSNPASYGDGESIIRLPTDLSYTGTNNKDFFAAENWMALDDADNDVGGSGVVLFSAPGATPSDLAIAFGKDGTAYLADRGNLGGMGGQLGTVKVVATEAIMQSSVAYTTPTGTFVAIRAHGMGCPSGAGQITTLKVSSAAPPTVSIAWCAGMSSTGSPMVTTIDGTNESIVWYVAGTKLFGFNGETGDMVFGGGSDTLSASDKWETPIVAKGRIFFAASNQLYAFKL